METISNARLLAKVGENLLNAGACASNVHEYLLKLSKRLNPEAPSITVNYREIIISHNTTIVHTSIEKSSGLDISNLHELENSLMDVSSNAFAFQAVKPCYAAIVKALAAGVALSSIAVQLGSSLYDLPGVFIATLVCYYSMNILSIRKINNTVSVFISTVIVGIVAVAGAYATTSLSPQATIIAPLLFLLPAFSIIIGVVDILKNHVIAGLDKLVSGCAVFLLLTAGLTAVMAIAPTRIASAPALPIIAPWIDFVIQAGLSALTLTGLAMLFNAPPRSLLLFAVTGMFIKIFRTVCISIVGLQYATACFWTMVVLTLLLILWSNYYTGAKRYKLPVSVLSVSIVGAISLFPGSSYVYALDGLALLASQTTETLSQSLLVETILFFMRATASSIALILGIVIPYTLFSKN